MEKLWIFEYTKKSGNIYEYKTNKMANIYELILI